MEFLNPVSFRDVEITEGFWAQRQKLNRDVTIYAVEDRFRETGRFESFKFGWKEGSDLPKPHYFWDSDIAKWIESAAYIIQKHDAPELADAVREVIDDMVAHQQPDGYFNIYHTVVEPDLKFRDRNHHELYCLGHLIEAGVAWFNATGEDKLLKVLDRYVDLVIRVFTVEHSASFSVPGHEEIELALIKLYRLRKDPKYLKLAMFFLNQRGTADGALGGWAKPFYDQNHLPVREQKTAEGHSVRACYLYSAMADAAAETGDESLLAACSAIFDDIFYKKMYITGGIGSSNKGEAFTVPFDLPNDTAYTETCAAIALAFFANRMKDLQLDSRYADVVERALYNGILSGVSLDGKSFFYENPLEINLRDHVRNTSVNDSERLPITQRLEVFSCSCCPPNVTRLIASVGDYLFSYDKNRVIVHQFAPCDALIDGMTLNVDTRYPSDGAIRFTLAGGKGRSFLVRIPGWCKDFSTNAPYELQNGYACFQVNDDLFELSVVFDITPRFWIAKSDVSADVGRVALSRGPIVYCLEGKDHAFPVSGVSVSPNEAVRTEDDAYFGVPLCLCSGEIPDDGDLIGLYYAPDAIRTKSVALRFVPYFGFANRGESDMRVWIHRTSKK